MTMESNIHFKIPLQDKWSAVFQWISPGRVGISVHWDNKVAATYAGEAAIRDLRRMLDTFEALDMADSYKKTKDVMLPGVHSQPGGSKVGQT